MRHTLALLFTVLFAISAHADDSIWVYKKAFKETYHLDKNCPVIAGKKLLAFSLSDETETRQKMRTAIQLADPCEVCKTPNIRNTRDNRLDDVLSQYLGASFTMDDEEEDGKESSDINIPFTAKSYFDDEIIIGLPEETKITSTIFKRRGQRFKMLEVKRAMEDRLIGSPVICEVISSRKSNISGREGELVIRPLYLSAEDGTIIRLKHDDIIIRGRNRQNIKLITFFFPPMWFVPGEGAKVRPTDEFVVTLDPSAEIAADGMVKKEMEQKRAAETEAKAAESENEEKAEE